jgi:hypothetical protein
MTYARVYYLKGKWFDPIFHEIESRPDANVLRDTLAIYFRDEKKYVILTIGDAVSKIVEKHGAVEVLDDMEQAKAYDDTYSEFGLYGKKNLIDITVPYFTTTTLLLNLPMPSKS